MILEQDVLSNRHAQGGASIVLIDEAFAKLLGEITNRPAWQADALCREYPEVEFFPAPGGRGDAAKAVCSRCLVQDECRQMALDGDEHGIWGGTSVKNRRALKRGTSTNRRPPSGTSATHAVVVEQQDQIMAALAGLGGRIDSPAGTATAILATAVGLGLSATTLMRRLERLELAGRITRERTRKRTYSISISEGAK